MTVSSTGRRTFFHQRGANAKLAPAHFDFTTTKAKWFHLGYLLLLDTLDTLGADGRPAAVEVLARARAAGLLTSVDCVSESAGRFPTHVAPVLPEVDVLFVNDYEAEQLTGIALGRAATLDRGAVERAARALIARGVRAWVVLHFPEGVCACSVRGEIVWQTSVRVPAASIAGTAGAGDALASGILLGLHEEWPMARALELGVCAAAASLRSPTCSDAVVTAGECLATGRALGFHALPA
jgi:sugar/nucleoside kinase (ribokinase family)